MRDDRNRADPPGRVDDAVPTRERRVIGEHLGQHGVEVGSIVGVLVAAHEFGGRFDLLWRITVQGGDLIGPLPLLALVEEAEVADTLHARRHSVGPAGLPTRREAIPSVVGVSATGP